MITFETPINIKTQEEVKKMAEGGRKLHEIKERLKKIINEGAEAYEIEKEADDLIGKTGGKPSFKMVPGYHWSTCVNVNDGLVHGIPRKDVVFKKGDIVSVDIGLYYKGLHTDSSFTVGIAPEGKTKKFLDVGQVALDKSVSKVLVGNRIFDISRAIETTIISAGYSTVKALVGHGVGRALHEEPAIPCFCSAERSNSPEIVKGMTLAIEVMYTLGSEELVLGSDGWTISTRDGKISALFEETVAVTPDGPLILT